jgi:hypothetical protein
MALPAYWHTHDWINKRGQRFTDERGKEFIRCHCRLCGRDFLRDPDADTAIAIHVGPMRYDSLEDEISDRWLNESCPLSRQAEDDAAQRRIKGS